MRVAASRTSVVISLLLVLLATDSVATPQQAARPLNERGPVDAPVTVVEFCTYDSEACSRLDIVLDAVLLEFGDRVRFVFRHVPADDTLAASLRYRAAMAAGQQGQFWPMHQLLMANRQHATRADVLAMAHQLGLDAERFRADLDSAETIAATETGQDDAAVQAGAAAPALIVNRRSLAVTSEARDIRAAIRLALATR
jgi:protein-disulfide isomerase